MLLDAVHSYPLKGGYRFNHDAAQVEPWGLAGDRRWLVIDTAGELVAQPDVPRLGQIRATPTSTGVILRVDGHPDLAVARPQSAERVPAKLHWGWAAAIPTDPAADEWFSEALDMKVRLVRLDEPARGYHAAERSDSDEEENPLLLTTLASLDAVNGWLLESGSVEGPVPMTRFRPNVVVAGSEPWAEDGWLGRRIRIGEVEFDVYKACDRCVITTIDQETGERGHEPLRMLGVHRNIGQKLLFGVYLRPAGTGRIAVGDQVTVG